MPLVPAICTQCGAQIEVDNTHEAGICKHCGTAFITEKAINNYHVVNNISAKVVNVYTVEDSDFVIVAGTLQKYKGVPTNVIIPDAVKIIGNGAFSGCVALENVHIPDSITVIEDSAFLGCANLKKITIPKSVTRIGSCAFAGCTSLKNLVIPGNVKEIGAEAFSGCTSLRSVDIQEGVRSFIARNGGISNPYDNASDGRSDCFAHCNLEIVSIPDSLEEVNLAFFYANVSQVRASEHWKIAHCTDSGLKVLKDEYFSKKKNNGCYIATCIYDTYDCPQVWTLRRFRDFTLDETWYGRVFIKCYYAISPTLVKWFGNQKWFRTFWKNRLDSMVSNLNQKGIENTQYYDKY